MADGIANPHSLLLRWQFYQRLRRDQRLSTRAMQIAGSILDHLNSQSGESYPSEERMADFAGVDVKTVERAIKELVTFDWFKVSARGRGNLYRPNYDNRLDLMPEEKGRRSITTPDKNVGSRPSEYPTDLSTTPDKSVPGHPTEMSAEPIEEPIIEPGASVEGLASQAPPSPDAIWEAGKAQIQSSPGCEDFDSWTADLAPLSDDGTIFELAVPSPLFVRKVEESFRTAIEAALNRALKVVISPHAVTARRQKRAKLS